jgi:hypothetical protein
MTPAVISLPVSPRLGAPLGLYLTAAAVGMLARLTGCEAVLAVNLLGAHGHTAAEAEHYLRHADAVCGPARHWTDTDADWPAILAEFVGRGRTEGWLAIRETEICRCACGLLEYPSDAPPDLDKRATGKVYERRDDGLHCRHCGSPAAPAVVAALYMELPDAGRLDVTPKWAASEAAAFVREFAGRALLVSRGRSTGIIATVDGHAFHLDPDLALMLLPFALAHEGVAAETIVTGNRTLKQAVLAAIVSRRLGLAPIAIVALPMLTLTDGQGQSAETDERAIVEHGGLTVRTVLAMAMGPTPKEVKLPTRNLRLAATSLMGDVHLSVPAPTPSAPWRLLGKQNIEATLAAVRRRQPLKTEQTIVLQALRT